MTFITRLLSALCWVTCSLSFSVAAQEVTTSGNLINNNNWSGATYGADPGGCCASISGSGALYDTTTDTIMFSYGTSTLSQTIGINQALGGTGIQVHGYNYGWDFRYISNNTTQNDSLSFNISLRDSSGTVVESRTLSWDNAMQMGIFNYDTWVTVNNSYTFDNPYTDPQSITLSMTGRDGGFWAGYYGPEVRNVSLSVNYTFDPCAADPLYSSSCEGYWEAWFQQYCLFWCSSPSEPEIEVASVDYSLTPSTTTSSMSMPEETTTGEVKVDAGGIEVTSTGELQVPDGIPEEAREKKPVDMNLIMSIVREATDDSKALEVVNQSIQDSMAEDANPDFTGTNEALAAIREQAQKSQEMEITIDVSSQLEATSIESVSNNIMQQTEIQLSDTQQDIIVTDTVRKDNDTETEALAIIERSMPQVDTNRVEEKEERVNRNVEPNEAASGSDIASIAISPIGFDDYLTKSLTDARFYQDKEIYAGQAVVDNRRAQRLLNGASDRLHREMVDQQYRRQ